MIKVPKIVMDKIVTTQFMNTVIAEVAKNKDVKATSNMSFLRIENGNAEMLFFPRENDQYRVKLTVLKDAA